MSRPITVSEATSVALNDAAHACGVSLEEMLDVLAQAVLN